MSKVPGLTDDKDDNVSGLEDEMRIDLSGGMMHMTHDERKAYEELCDLVCIGRITHTVDRVAPGDMEIHFDGDLLWSLKKEGAGIEGIRKLRERVTRLINRHKEEEARKEVAHKIQKVSSPPIGGEIRKLLKKQKVDPSKYKPLTHRVNKKADTQTPGAMAKPTPRFPTQLVDHHQNPKETAMMNQLQTDFHHVRPAHPHQSGQSGETHHGQQIAHGPKAHHVVGHHKHQAGETTHGVHQVQQLEKVVSSHQGHGHDTAPQTHQTTQNQAHQHSEHQRTAEQLAHQHELLEKAAHPLTHSHFTERETDLRLAGQAKETKPVSHNHFGLSEAQFTSSFPETPKHLDHHTPMIFAHKESEPSEVPKDKNLPQYEDPEASKPPVKLHHTQDYAHLPPYHPKLKADD